MHEIYPAYKLSIFFFFFAGGDFIYQYDRYNSFQKAYICQNVVGILTFISMIATTSECLKARKVQIFQPLCLL